MKISYAIVATIIVVAMLFTFLFVFNTTVAPIMGAQSSVMQLEDSNQAYIESQTTSNPSFIRDVVSIIAFMLIAIIWVLAFLHNGEKRKNDNFYVLLPVIGVLLISTTACGLFGGKPPDPQVLVIQSHETAFVVPTKGDTTEQGQTPALEYYEDKQWVQSREIVITYDCVAKKSDGTCIYRPSSKMIFVSRAPSSRIWTNPNEGSENRTATDPALTKDQSFWVETKDSVGLWIGAVASAQIDADLAYLYLYYYPPVNTNPDAVRIDARPLDEVMDQDIRLYIQGILFDEFKKRDVDQAIAEASIIFENAFAAASAYALERGITLNFLKGSDGLVFDDPQIQNAINQQALLPRQLEFTRATAAALDVINEQLIAQANAQATATLIAGNAHAQVLQQQADVIARNPGLIQYLIAQTWNGQLPLYSGGSNGVPFIMQDVTSLVQATAPAVTPLATATATPLGQ